MASDPIPANVRKFWDSWSIRSFVILSLSLQIFLVLFSSYRSKARHRVVYFLIWSAYLVADWVPTFVAGLILNSLGNDNQSSTSKTDVKWNIDLLALWAASLLRHLGGTCSITAFSLEDNELWLRQLIGLVVQFTTAFYVFLCTLPNKKFLVPTIFALLGGLVRYAERVNSMYRASLDKYREVIVRHPYKLNVMYIELGLDKLLGESPGRPLDPWDVKEVAYHYFEIFKGLIVNLEYQSDEKERSLKCFYDRISSDNAYRVICLELSYMYQVFYTNTKTASFMGQLCFLISMVSNAVVLGKFVHAGKQDLDQVDIKISYTLFSVAIALDVMDTFQNMLLQKPQRSLSPGTLLEDDTEPIVAFVVRVILATMMFEGSKIEMEPNIEHEVYDTPAIFRGWSESIYSHNLISYCLKECPRRVYMSNKPSREGKRVMHCLQKVGRTFGIFRCVLNKLGLKDFLDQASYVSRYPFDQNLWDFIFANLKDISRSADPNAARDGWSLQHGEWCSDNQLLISKFLTYIKGVDYDQSLLVWHVATELCYNTEERSETTGSHERVYSTILSNYMIYLMVFQPSMMSTISGVFLRRFEATCKHINSIIHLRGDGKLQEACREILNPSPESLRPDSEEGDWRESELYRACSLAEELNRLQEGERWKIMSRVWLEMLVYAARNCRGDIHARAVSRGGELLTFVWLLMAHLGFTLGNQQQVRMISPQEQSG